MLKKIVFMRLTTQIFFFCLLSLFNCSVLLGDIQRAQILDLKVKDCLLPADHPLQEQLKNLFENSDMFQSSFQLEQEGFHLIGRTRRGFMVAGHPAIGNYLIKKFQDDTPRRQQIKNYLRRINGATALREFIQLNNLQHIVVPKKWLYCLPKRFSEPKTGKRTYVLIVEKIDLCNGGQLRNGEIAMRYASIDSDVLRELCLVVYYFRGLDSGLQNMPFTYKNKIAFIDTEHWENNREGFLKHAEHFLTQDRKDYALTIFNELLEQDLMRFRYER